MIEAGDKVKILEVGDGDSFKNSPDLIGKTGHLASIVGQHADGWCTAAVIVEGEVTISDGDETYTADFTSPFFFVEVKLEVIYESV